MMGAPAQRRRIADHAKTLYQTLTVEEDIERTNVHYEQPAEFFLTLTGGEWNTYSCGVWADAGTTLTQSQEAKLDMIASLLQLRPGMRLLEVGAGWGGPLTYLTTRYGVEGVGLTISPIQLEAARERFARYGAPARIELCHWQEFEDEDGFDAIYTDEVIVHFSNLEGYFRKMNELLRDGGRMVNRELHFVHPSYGLNITRAQQFFNEIYGGTGNYRTLADELTLLNQADFGVQHIHSVPISVYERTAEHWLNNMRRNRRRLIDLVGEETYRRFYLYIRICCQVARTNSMTLDAVVAEKVSGGPWFE